MRQEITDAAIRAASKIANRVNSNFVASIAIASANGDQYEVHVRVLPAERSYVIPEVPHVIA